MSQSPANEIVNLATANTAVAVTAPQYYERIIVTNETTGDVFIRTDGGTVASTEGNFGAIVQPGAWRMVGNDQPRQPNPSKAQDVEGWTVQNVGFRGATTPNLNPLASGSPTHVSVLSTVAGNVSVEFV